ncbi:MAG: hypothetical protein PHV77_00695 [Candidatus Omnitrophica bacterium]|jgi:hypothetical protein|nr:hypothetical protein [Candidatus Omnitrophota bacterium]
MAKAEAGWEVISRELVLEGIVYVPNVEKKCRINKGLLVTM